MMAEENAERNNMLAIHCLEGQRQSEDMFAIYVKLSKRGKFHFAGVGQSGEAQVIEIAEGMHERRRANGVMTRDGRTLVIKRKKNGSVVPGAIFPPSLPSGFAAENHEFVTLIMG